jgi:hypothetical protein
MVMEEKMGVRRNWRGMERERLRIRRDFKGRNLLLRGRLVFIDI